MMRLRSLVLIASTLLAASGLAYPQDPVSGALPPVFDPVNSDLLPLEEFERQDFQRLHGALVNSLRGMIERVDKAERDLAPGKQRANDARKRAEAELQRLRSRIAPLSLQLTDLLLAEGVPGWLIAHLNHAPKGPYRMERYATALVLLLELEPDQRALFERLVPQLEAGLLAISAQRERMELALKQSGLDAPAQAALLATFERQAREIETRFWHVTDFVLGDEQRAQLHDLMPTPLKQKAGAVEHLYALPGLTPSQGARLRSLLTEAEAESAPDQATVRRLQRELREKERSKEEAQQMREELAAAQVRLGELTRFHALAIKDVLTPEQVLAYRAIPPRISENERRRDGRRLLEGLPYTPEQLGELEGLNRSIQADRRELEGRARELREQTAEYGPDSPQMAGMQMMMNAVRSEGEALRRRLMGVAFLRILTPDQISVWVLGHYGEKR